MPDPIPPVDLASLAAGGGHSGARWRLDGEDLQANLVRLARADCIQPHHNDEVEVLVVVVSGRGELTLEGQVHQLAPMVVAHLQGDGQGNRGRQWAAGVPVDPPPPIDGTSGGSVHPVTLRSQGASRRGGQRLPIHPLELDGGRD